jgi:hypothetical protein
MSTLRDRLTAKAAVTQQPRRVSTIHWTEMAMLAALASGLAFGKVAQSGLAQELMAPLTSELQVVGEQWLKARKAIGWHRSSTSGRVECISDYDPDWEARHVADRVESGSPVVVGCLQVRIARD